MLFIGSNYTRQQSEDIGQIASEILQELGHRVHILPIAPEEGSLYPALFDLLEPQDGLVVWLGERLDKEGQGHMRRYLEGGGRLLLASDQFHLSEEVEPFLRHVLQTQGVTGPTTGTIRSFNLSNPVSFALRHYRLNPLFPAETVLLNGHNETAGLRLDEGRYRVVYLPFRLSSVQPPETQRHLLA